MPRITALSTVAFAGFPLSLALEQIQARGFRAVELVEDGERCRHFEPGVGATDAMRSLLRATFLQPIALDYSDTDIGRIRAVILQCRSLGIVKLNVVPTASGQPAKRGEEIGAAAKSLSDLADYALDNGSRLTVDAPHSTGVLDTAERVGQFFSHVTSAHLGITVDTRHGSTLKEFENLWATAGPRIWHVRLDGHSIAALPLGQFAALLDRHAYRANVTVALRRAGRSLSEIGNEIDASLRRLAAAGWQLPKTVQMS
ncbi:MAG: sugar phosphate isomerase/epimerase family protein [Chloroflexota bacterium]